MRSFKGTSNFYSTWEAHLSAAQSYNTWQQSYAKCTLEYSYKDTDKINYDQFLPLARLFHQYISFLSEFSNSKHDQFPQEWLEFVLGKKNKLFYAFQEIYYILQNSDDIAKIAPVYVLRLFQKQSRKLYCGTLTLEGTILCVKLSRKRPFDVEKALIMSKAVTNQKAPKRALTVMYELLCEYFINYTEFEYDRTLCDYIFQRMCPLIGQKTCEEVKQYTEEIIRKGTQYSLDKFSMIHTWVHPLLQEIYKRLEMGLSLYADSIPRFALSDIPVQRDERLINQTIDIIKADINFLNDYEEILINDILGFHESQISSETLEKFADLIDRKISMDHKLHKRLCKEDSGLDLAIVEETIHKTCLNEIYRKSFDQTIQFLYQYLMSNQFAAGKEVCEVTGKPEGNKVKFI